MANNARSATPRELAACGFCISAIGYFARRVYFISTAFHSGTLPKLR